jgi:hypothetical protein
LPATMNESGAQIPWYRCGLSQVLEIWAPPDLDDLRR